MTYRQKAKFIIFKLITLTRFLQLSASVADLVGRTGGNSAGPEGTANVKRGPHGPFCGPLGTI
jgi:hypothetical protein